MKKITEFLNQPFTTTLLCVVGLTGGFLLGIAIKNLIDLETIASAKKAACKDAYSVMCVQAHACTGGSVETCDSIVEENEMCNVNLPDIQVIFQCKEELRNIECQDNMPVSCMLFMEE